MPLTREEQDFIHSATSYFKQEREFTMRDKFAVAAMQTLLQTKDGEMSYDNIAAISYCIADRMLLQRDKKKDN